MEAFELAILFSAAGALVGAGLIKTLVSAGKGWGIVPEHGRGVLFATAILAAILIALAGLDADWIGGDDIGQDVLVIVLAWVNIYAASIGVHETAIKVQSIVSNSTTPDGPDGPAG